MGMPPKETVGRRLRRFRQERGLTQEDVAGGRFSTAYISQIESDKRQPTKETLEHLASRLDVTTEELVTGRPGSLAPELSLLLEASRNHVYSGDASAAEIGFARVLKEAKRHDLPVLRAQAEEGLGLIERRAGRAKDAKAHYETALALRTDEPLPTHAESIVGLARCYRMLGETRYSAHILENYLNSLNGSGLTDPFALMLTHAALVTTYFSLGLFEQAASSGREAMRLEPAVQESHEVANMHINVAQVFARERRWDDAMRALERARETYAALEWHNEVARALNAEAIVLRERGDLRGARRVLEEALERLDKAPSRLEEARVLNELARVERLSGKSKRALSLLERSAPLLEESDILDRAFRERELALCAGTDFSVAEAHLRAAIELYGRAEHAQETAVTFRALGDLHRQRGDLESSVEAYMNALDSALS
jgi:tetratricopeptide (TPR) repeat protein